MLTARLGTCIVPCVFIIFLWTSCSDEQLFPGNARLKTTFRLKSMHALDGSIAIQQAYLKLEGISVTGALGNENVPEATYPISSEDPPYRLTLGDTAQMSLTLPTRVYDEMDLHLFLLQTDYQLIVHQKPNGETPPPVNEGNGESGGSENDANGGNETGGSTDSGDQSDGDQDDAGDEDEEGGDHEDDDDGRDEDTNHDDDDDDDGDHDHDDGDHSNDDGDDNDKKNKDGKKKDKKKGNGKDDDKGKGDRDDDERDDSDGNDDRTRSNEVTGTVDLDHFFQQAKPSLVVFATWTLNGENINIVFAVTDVERITIPAMQNDGPRIMVDEHGRASVNFNPERWFESISTKDLENASLQRHQGQSVMFIHKDVNTSLFERLLNNLIKSATFEIETPGAQ